MKLKWTLNKLQEEANKYLTRGEFRNNSAIAYNKAWSNKILDDLFKNHKNNGFNDNRKKVGYWTIEKLQEEANKYNTKIELWNNNNAAAKAVSRKNLMDELFKNHINNGHSKNKLPNGYWTKERLQEEANKYNTRNDLKKNNLSSYNAACSKKILNDLFKNHKNEGYSDYKWQNHNYVIYVYELPEFNKAYVGLTINIDRRDKEHLFDQKELLNLFCKENNISYPTYKILEEKLNSDEARKQECYWVDFYKNNKWKLFNITKPGSLGGGHFKWTKTLLEVETNKYKTRTDFYKNNGGAYNAARRLNILDDLFKNHINNGRIGNQKEFKYWTKEKCQDIANKCQTRKEFRENLGAYNAARRLNILDDLFKNHINQGRTTDQKISGYWTKEKLQEESNKYLIRNDFRKNDINAYSRAKSKKILDDLFKNHINQGYKRDCYIKKEKSE
jgi:hypothetical protein